MTRDQFISGFDAGKRALKVTSVDGTIEFGTLYEFGAEFADTNIINNAILIHADVAVFENDDRIREPQLDQVEWLTPEEEARRVEIIRMQVAS